MAKKQTRRTFSINRVIYDEIVRYAHARGVSASSFVEDACCAAMGVPVPEKMRFDAAGTMIHPGPRDLYADAGRKGSRKYRDTVTRLAAFDSTENYRALHGIDSFVGPQIPSRVHIARTINMLHATHDRHQIGEILGIGHACVARYAKQIGVTLKRKIGSGRARNRSTRSSRAADFLEQHPELSQREVARRFKVTHQAVSYEMVRRRKSLPVADPADSPPCAPAPDRPTL